MGFRVAAAVAAYSQRVRRFFYAVVLSQRFCSRCGGDLVMIKESRCRCANCGHELDPTVAFQRCSDCGGRPKISVRRYRCSSCGADVPSRFVFDGLVFDAEYFRAKMAESRLRKQEERALRTTSPITTRSAPLDSEPIDLRSVPGLVEVLDRLTSRQESGFPWPVPHGFDLRRYESHIRAHIGPFEVSFDDIPPIEEDARKDRIWRFVAIIFMAHRGVLTIRQQGRTIMVIENDNRER